MSKSRPRYCTRRRKRRLVFSESAREAEHLLPQEAQIIRSDLKALGIDVQVQAFPIGVFCLRH